jgi:nucleoside-diphosphate-sugar epimerase
MHPDTTVCQRGRMTRVLVTGANGFIGSILCPLLTSASFRVRVALRQGRSAPVGAIEHVTIGEISADTDWTDAVSGVDHIIHLAARAHCVNDGAAADARYVQTNADGTRSLAAAAAACNVTRFVYLSSIKVNGEGARLPYRANDPPLPEDSYARSKWLAEQLLWDTALKTSLQIAVVRAPLVYGPGVRANFLRLLDWVDRAWPLPFGAVQNKRSLVSVWNLCDLLIRLLDHPMGAGATWMVSDGQDVSTPELLRRIGGALGRPVRLLPIPSSVLQHAGAVLGRRTEMRRLCSSLTADIGPTVERLGWVPAISLTDALSRTASWYRSNSRQVG